MALHRRLGAASFLDTSLAAAAAAAATQTAASWKLATETVIEQSAAVATQEEHLSVAAVTQLMLPLQMTAVLTVAIHSQVQQRRLAMAGLEAVPEDRD